MPPHPTALYSDDGAKQPPMGSSIVVKTLTYNIHSLLLY